MPILISTDKEISAAISTTMMEGRQATKSKEALKE
jgi:hypothetical protein